MASGDAPRSRVLISAFACEPGLGSEPGTGWLWSAAAAVHHDVTLLVPPSRRPVLQAALAARPELSLTPAYVDGPAWLPGAPDEQRAFRLRYALWQRQAARTARRLHAEHPFDVAHHLTLGADWQPAGVGALDGVAFVWGPVGGYTRPAWRLARWLGPRWALDEVVRRIVTGGLRAGVGRNLARRATIAVAQNPDVAGVLRRYGTDDVRVEPNVAIDPDLLPDPTPATGSTGVRGVSGSTGTAGPNGGVSVSPDRAARAVFVGRLLRWKGMRLALRALARPELQGWTLDVYGDGPDRPALLRRIERLGLGTRVTLHGTRPRPEVMAAIAGAGALVLPSVNDSAGWVAAEALALGCPVVCLDRGGPPVIAAGCGAVVGVGGDVPGALARAWAGVLAAPDAGSRRWSTDRLVAVVDRWYADAVRAGPRERVRRLTRCARR